MHEPNQTTIEAYNRETDAYILNTPHSYQPYHKPMLNWIDTALAGLQGDKVLEIGSATSRDADYMRAKGYKVQTSDASESFVQRLRKNGDNAILFNALDDPIPGKYSLIFANAVAPHFTRADMIKFLDKINDSLRPKERLAFNLKTGTGEQWVNEKLPAKRFICYWQPNDIKQLLQGYGFTLVFFESDVAGDLPSHHWINIVIEKT